MQYKYPKITTGGYRWNLLKRCLWEVGIEPVGITDVGNETVLDFSRELTSQEKTILDGIMSGDPQNPPSTGVRLTVRDVWEDFEVFKTACGLPNLRIFFTESVPGSGKVDRVTLWHPTSLTNSQKNSVKTAYTNMFLS